jgi:hypothetical protein
MILALSNDATLYQQEANVNDKRGKYTRLRYTAAGAVAALAAAGAIAGAVALAASPPPKAHGHAAAANGQPIKPPGSPADKSRGQAPTASPQPFLDDIQRLVDNGTITSAEGQVIDREILAGRVDTDTLAAAGFTQAQLQAVQQALSGTKAGLAAAAHGNHPAKGG